MIYTRSGRPALEQKCKGHGHWHIEGWCAVKDDGMALRALLMSWKATNGPCQYLELDAEGARWAYATSLNAMRDRIREEIWNEGKE